MIQSFVPVFAPVQMRFTCCLAAFAGFTGGGVKMVRALLLVNGARREFKRIVHPRSIVPVTLGGTAVGSDVLQSVLAIMLVYGAVLVGATMLLARLELFSILFLFTGNFSRK